MAGSVNKVILIGNLGKDPEIRTTQDGKEIASLALATSESWKDRATGERKEKTEWHRISVFSEGLVGVIKNYMKKGAKLYVEGSLQTRKWVDNAGVEKYTTEIVIQNYNGNITMLDSRGSNSGSDYSDSSSSSSRGGSSSSKASTPAHEYQDLDDEIPF